MASPTRRITGTLVAALAVCGLVTSPAALAAKSPARSSAGLTLASDYVWNSPNVAAPLWCLNEDDWHVRTWSGALDGTFAATERLCDAGVDYSSGMWWDAGGVGLQADLVVAGSLRDLAITSPQGDSHHAVLVDSTTSRRTTLNHYQVCYVPAYGLAGDTAGLSLPGGNWQITLAGTVTQVSLTVRARMTDVLFQQQSCPPSQQNLL